MKEIDFFTFWGVFVKHWKTILAVGIAGAVVAFLVTRFLITPRYTADTKLFAVNIKVDDANETEARADEHKSLEPLTYQEIMLTNMLVNDYKEFIATRTLRAAVDAKLNARLDAFVPDEKTSRAMLDLLDSTPRKLDYQVEVGLVRQARVVKVSVTSAVPELSVWAADLTSEELIAKINKLIFRKAYVVDEAVRPIAPSYPSTRRNVLLALVLAAGATYAFFFLRGILDRSIKTPDEITGRLNLPLLGTIMEDEKLDALANDAENNPDAPARIIAVGANARERFAIAEGFRLLRTNLQYSLPQQGRANIFVITSTLPNDGKTFLASNLAASIADSGKRVLLVNCDLHKPFMGKLFGLGNDAGIVNILVGEKTFDQVVTRQVMQLPLDLLTSGPVPPNPSKLLLSDEFAALIAEQAQHYDYILLDTPPCLSIADAAIIGRVADGIILVTSSGQTDIDAAENAVAQLKQLSLNVVGAVLNRFSLTRLNYGGKYGYGYGYGHNAYGYGYGYGGKSPGADGSDSGKQA